MQVKSNGEPVHLGGKKLSATELLEKVTEAQRSYKQSKVERDEAIYQAWFHRAGTFQQIADAAGLHRQSAVIAVRERKIVHAQTS